MFLTHPVINMKCVVFSALVIGLFFFRPHECIIRSKTNTFLVGYLIFFFSYLTMAIYDEYHFRNQCSGGDLLLKTGSGPTSILKPKARKQQQVSIKETGPQMLVIWLSHVVFLAPLVIYLGIYGIDRYTADNNNNKGLNTVLLFLGVMTILYHGGRLLTYIQQENVADGQYLIESNAARRISWDAIVDVRSLYEYNNTGNLTQAIHAPGDEIRSVAQRYNFKKDFNILVVCRSGSRAHKSAELLQKDGFYNTFALNGNWSELI